MPEPEVTTPASALYGVQQNEPYYVIAMSTATEQSQSPAWETASLRSQ